MKRLTARVWERLIVVKSLSFVARSSAVEKTGWTGEAKGTVQVQRCSPVCTHFVESGSWTTPAGRRVDFSNTYRWTLSGSGIRLEHLRFGIERPVHLVDLVPAAGNRMISERPHGCAEDLYRASLELGEDLKLRWSITGPRKRETIDCRYSGEEREQPVIPANAVSVKKRGST